MHLPVTGRARLRQMKRDGRERGRGEREREVAAWESAVSSLKVKMICIKLVTVTRTLKGPQLQSLGQTYAAPR